MLTVTARSDDARPPLAVRRAVTLMVFGALVQAVSTLQTWLDRDGTRAQTASLAKEFKHRVLSGPELERATDQAHGVAVGTGLLCIALWLVVARLCWRGRALGRSAATVLAVVYGFTFILSGVRSFGPGAVIGVLTVGLGVSVVYLLWRRPVTPWLSSQAAARERVAHRSTGDAG